MQYQLKNETVKFTKGRIFLRCMLLTVLIALVPAAYFLPSLLVKGQAADYYSEKIFPVISMLPISISGIFLTSLTEMFVVVGSLSVLTLAVVFLIKCVTLCHNKSLRHMFHFMYLVLRALAVIGIIGALVFECMLGLNYHRTGVRKRMHLYSEQTRPYEDYSDTLLWAYSGMVEARHALGEDYNGVAHMMTSFESMVYDANIAVSTVDYYYELGLSDNYIRAKAVWLSKFWRYTDIVGMYDPFLGEANINTDYIDILHLPLTICHEISHARGYGSETDCNTIAALSCINSDRPDFRYAGYYYIFTRLWTTVRNYAEYEGEPMPDYTSRDSFRPVMRDMSAYSSYLDSFDEGPIAEFISYFSEDANNAFLESNGQQGGTQTYEVPQDVYVEYYCRYIRDHA